MIIQRNNGERKIFMEMEIIIKLFEVVLLPVLTCLIGFVANWIRIKAAALQNKEAQNLSNKYISLLEKTITDCVITTNQTYVNTLKTQGKFDKEAQELAFEKTYQAVMTLLNEETKRYLNELTNDATAYIKTQIEVAVNKNKEEKTV